MKATYVVTLLLAACNSFPTMAIAVRQFHRRSDLVNTPPIAESGYVVPLQGSAICTAANTCTSELPPPPAGQVLKYLALARGVTTYNCSNKDPASSPMFMSQDATLWDAAPLLPHIPNEPSFHTVTPQLLQFDYATLNNSSLLCMGGVHASPTQTIIDLFDVTAFPIRLQASVGAPGEPAGTLLWAYSTSLDLTWSVYRVKTVGGIAPSTCRGQSDVISVDYAAEYWLYHK